MAAPFDPYLHWLGIRDPERPPNHYRLLGVAAFESDPDVLANAADRQMSHVRTFQSGKHSAQSQRLLNELSAAKVCLLHRGRKVAYDAQLRAVEAHKAVAPPPVAPPVVEPLPASPASSYTFDLLDEATPAGGEVSIADLALRDKWSKRLFPVAMLAGLALILIGLIVVFASISREESAESVVATRAIEAPKTKPRPEPKWELPPPVPVKPEPEPEPLTPEPSKPEPMVFEPPKPREDERYEVPDADALAEALQEIRELFEDRYAGAKDRDQRRNLARTFMQQATATRDNSAARFMLYSEARDMAISAGDSNLLMTIFTTMGREYRLDWESMATESLVKAVKKPRDNMANHSLGRLTLELARKAVVREDFDRARLLADASRELARKARDNSTIKQAIVFLKDVDQREELHAAFVEADKLLATQPDDAEANATAARYYCVVKNDWSRGLRLVFKGNDDALRNVATADLEQSSSLPTELAAMGDRWYNVQREVAESNRSLARARAVYWYRLALPDVRGLTLSKVERRLAELSE